MNGTGEDFECHAGFVNRSNIINAGLRNRFTWYGPTGALLERITTFLGPSRILEGSAGDSRSARASLAVRPASAVRIDLSTSWLHIRRARDGSEFARTLLPRLRMEVQPARAFFLRGIMEYRAERRDALRDARTGEPLRVAGSPAAGVLIERRKPRASRVLSADTRHRRVPRYAAALNVPDPFAFDRLARSRDGDLPEARLPVA